MPPDKPSSSSATTSPTTSRASPSSSSSSTASSLSMSTLVCTADCITGRPTVPPYLCAKASMLREISSSGVSARSLSSTARTPLPTLVPTLDAAETATATGLTRRVSSSLFSRSSSSDRAALKTSPYVTSWLGVLFSGGPMSSMGRKMGALGRSKNPSVFIGSLGAKGSFCRNCILVQTSPPICCVRRVCPPCSTGGGANAAPGRCVGTARSIPGALWSAGAGPPRPCTSPAAQTAAVAAPSQTQRGTISPSALLCVTRLRERRLD
mmetsp:Transcript_36869/g.71933  ORF Transcript_36869/g.71933 Transcript_36869/m.71933 type:complete len:266 (-) Transcript_36869:98-895(-)